MEESNLSTGSGSPYPPPQMNYVVKKETLPSAVTALVFGIVSLCTLAWFGWIMAIVALNNARKAQQLVMQNPGRFSDISLSMTRAGHTMGLIGLILGLLGILVWILYFAFIILAVGLAGHGSYNHYF